MLSVEHVAQALVTTLLKLPADQHADACKQAVEMLRNSGLHREVRKLPKLVAKQLRRQSNEVAVTVTTVSGSLGDAQASLESAIQSAVGGQTSLQQKKDVSLLGGAIVQLGDTRIDSSLKGALASLTSSLSA